jgi:hypothetical protein
MKKRLKNIVYEISVIQLPDPSDEFEQYKFKDLGYLVLFWWYEEPNPMRKAHGFVTTEYLKELLGVKQYAKFCQGKRTFIIENAI